MTDALTFPEIYRLTRQIVISLANITASIAQTRQADCTAAAASLTSGD